MVVAFRRAKAWLGSDQVRGAGMLNADERRSCVLVSGSCGLRPRILVYLGDFMLWCLVTAGRCWPLAKASCCSPGGFGAKFGFPKLIAGFVVCCCCDAEGSVGVGVGVAVEGGDDF